MNTTKFWPYTAENIHPGFSVDCVILSFHKGKLNVLVSKFCVEDLWALPGGFMLNDEAADEAAYRILSMRTGLTDIFLRQFHLFSDPKRTSMEQNRRFITLNASYEEEGNWLLRRYVTLGFYALVKYDKVKLSSIEGELLEWHPIDSLPRLYSDHEHIIKTALKTIQTLLPVIPIGYELLPEKFTMTELRKIYEGILGKMLDRRNFQRKILAEGYVVQSDETGKSQTYNAPILYSFNFQGGIEYFQPKF